MGLKDSTSEEQAFSGAVYILENQRLRACRFISERARLWTLRPILDLAGDNIGPLTELYNLDKG